MDNVRSNPDGDRLHAALGVAFDPRPRTLARRPACILAPGGILAIVEYVRDREGSPIAAALIEFMSRYGSERAYGAA